MFYTCIKYYLVWLFESIGGRRILWKSVKLIAVFSILSGTQKRSVNSTVPQNNHGIGCASHMAVV